MSVFFGILTRLPRFLRRYVLTWKRSNRGRGKRQDKATPETSKPDALLLELHQLLKSSRDEEGGKGCYIVAVDARPRDETEAIQERIADQMYHNREKTRRRLEQVLRELIKVRPPLLATALINEFTAELHRHACWSHADLLARALGEFGNTECTECLMRTLANSPLPCDASALVTALGKARDVRAEGILVQLFHREMKPAYTSPDVAAKVIDDSFLRVACVESIAQINGPNSKNVVHEALSDPDESVRQSAARVAKEFPASQ